jgi:hypothetical protein
MLRLKIPLLVTALIASVALAVPTEAAKKRKKNVYRAPIGVVQPKSHPHDVYVGGEYQGRDPDPNIRAFMRRSPRIWDGSD